VHKFTHDFYGAEMSLIVAGFLRESLKFESLDELITAIANDVSVGCAALQSEPLLSLSSDPFLHEPLLPSPPPIPSPSPTSSSLISASPSPPSPSPSTPTSSSSSSSQPTAKL
jgi:hypothetical protein